MQTNEHIVEAVQEHWVLSGVDVDVAAEMADELADHLAAAAEDGKSVEAVVGDDLRAFADEWSVPVADQETPLRRLQLVLMGAVTFAMVSVGASALFDWTTDVIVEPVTTGFAAILGGITAMVAVGPTTSRLRSGTTLRHPAVIALAVGLTFGVLMSSWFVLARRFEGAWTVTLPRWLVLIATALTLFVTVGPLLALATRIDQTDGWSKKIFRALTRFW